MAATASIEQEPGAKLGVVEDLIGYHMRRAFAVIGGDFARALDGTGIRQVLFGILSVVAANPGINQGAVGRMLGIQRANMVLPVNELVERGWIDRQVNPGDRRALTLALTGAGQAVFADACDRIRAHEDRVASDLGMADRQQLIALLARIEARESEV